MSPRPRPPLLDLLPVCVLLTTLGCRGPSREGSILEWAGVPDRPWAGAEIWANRLQDWRVRGERLEAVPALPMRTAHVLTRSVDPTRGAVTITVEMGFQSPPSSGQASAEESSSAQRQEGPGRDEGAAPGEAEERVRDPGPGTMEDTPAIGVLLGVGGPGLDPRRRALIHHSPGPGAGLFFGVDGGGHLFAADFSRGNRVLARSSEAVPVTDALELTLRVEPTAETARVLLNVAARGDPSPSLTLDTGPFSTAQLTGGLALVSHGPSAQDPRGWFSWSRLEGSGWEVVPDGALGPILGAQHVLSRGRLGMTAQLFPVRGPMDGDPYPPRDSVSLEIQGESGQWEPRGSAPVIIPGYTATFQVDDWPVDRDVPYRLTYKPATEGAGGQNGQPYAGTVQREPDDKTEIVVAAFTGNHNVASPGVDRGAFDWAGRIWFPHEDIVDHVRLQEPDLLFFSGDQVYEGASPTAADFDHPYGDYLYKWYLWLWAFRDLTRDIPSIAIPDDHDVFHGNVWGAGGRPTPQGLAGAEAQDRGGYKLPPPWVNMVQRTQASHLPAPRVPEASEHGIATYVTDVQFGGISFAVLEDRKFKSPPKLLLPEAGVWNGWAQNPSFDPRTEADAPGASLLGRAQERFLDTWAGEWGEGTWMKVVLSQTIFANVATIPAEATNGSVIPSLPIPEPGAWLEGDKLAADMDSNGWPPSGRDRALLAMRRGFAVHLAGDQHLASTIQYGVDHWGDGPFALCVPSVANFWPRRWYPPAPGLNRPEGAPAYAGDFEDGFGNLMTVFAVSNPARWGREPEILHDRAPGYGVARFNRVTREVSLEAWPRWADPSAGGSPYPGWPVRFRQQDGYGGRIFGFLPTLLAQGIDDPVVQVVSEEGGEIVYTLRIPGNRFTPRVFEDGRYSIGIGEPGTRSWRVLMGQVPAPDSSRVLEVRF